MTRQQKKAAGQTTTTAKRRKGNTGEFAYKTLRSEIISLELEPGVGLDEGDVVRRLGLSRTPVREAFVRLAGEGLVQLMTNRGARVAPLGWSDIREHLEAFDVSQRLINRWSALRRLNSHLEAMKYECAAFEAAVKNQDGVEMTESNWRFHATIATGARNSVVEQFYRQLLTGNLRISRLAMVYENYKSKAAYKAHIGNIVREHREMIDAIGDMDADRAEELAGSHADLARKRISECLTETLTPEMRISSSRK